MELIKVVGSKGENQRYAGALVLRALAENAPAVVYDRRAAFFSTIWLVINDLTVRCGFFLSIFYWGGGGEGGVVLHWFCCVACLACPWFLFGV